MTFIPGSRSNAASVSILKRSIMQTDPPPLADMINDQRWQQVFVKHKMDFSSDEEPSPARRSSSKRAATQQTPTKNIGTHKDAQGS